MAVEGQGEALGVAGAGLLGLELGLFVGVGLPRGDDLEDPSAEDLQGGGVVLGGVGGQCLLGQVDLGGVEVLGELLECVDDDAGLVQGHLAACAAVGEGVPAVLERGGEADQAGCGGAVLVGGHGPPGAGRRRAGLRADLHLVGVGRDPQGEGVQARPQPGQGDQGLAGGSGVETDQRRLVQGGDLGGEGTDAGRDGVSRSGAGVVLVGGHERSQAPTTDNGPAQERSRAPASVTIEHILDSALRQGCVWRRTVWTGPTATAFR